jgi:hypothetical protein
MSTASVYKGANALLAHALLAARANGVLEHVLEDLRDGAPELLEDVELWLAHSATKAHRYVGEMREIAAAQEAAGLPPELFDGFAAAWAALARSPLGRTSPESVATGMTLEDVLDALSGAGAGRDVEEGSPRAS